MIWRSSDNASLRIYSTTVPATNRLYTLMHDLQYRLGIAWQNVRVGNGRIYSIQVEARDAAGNTTLQTVTVSVPLER